MRRQSFGSASYRRQGTSSRQAGSIPAALLFLTVGTSYAAITAKIDVAPSTTGNIGTPMHFSASVIGLSPGTVTYRFRSRRLGDDYKIIRDYSPLPTLDWTPVDYDGSYQVEATARNAATGEMAVTSTTVQLQSLATDGQPLVTATAHPLVFLYSTPPCGPGQKVKIPFQAPDIAPQGTPFKTCLGGSASFYLAGLRPDAAYTAHQVLDTGSAMVAGPDISFTTGDIPANLLKEKVLVWRQTLVSPILLTSPLLGIAPVAFDLSGAVVWYGPPGLTSITRAEAGGQFWALIQNTAGPAQQLIRKIDLVGATLLETNAGRVNEQLKALGKREITTFHHEVRTLPGGRIAALASVEQILSGVQGSAGPVDILGDMIVVFDDQLTSSGPGTPLIIWT